MSTAEHLAREGFRRQVTFRAGADDAALLEAAARAHGGIQAGIVAALRAYAAQRLRASVPDDRGAEDHSAPASPAEPTAQEAAPRGHATPLAPPARTRPRKTPSVRPAPDEDLVELNVGEAAPVLGLSAAALRERIKRGAHERYVGSTGLYVARIPLEALRASNLELSPRGAAEVLGLRPSTIKSRCKAGCYPNARNSREGGTTEVAAGIPRARRGGRQRPFI